MLPDQDKVPAPMPSKSEIAARAVLQHGAALQEKFPNIVSISDAVKGKDDYVIAIYVRDGNTESIPAVLTVSMPDGIKAEIATEIVANVGTAIPHVSQQTTNISDSNAPAYTGSICCFVASTSVPGFIGAVTCGHVLSQGSFNDMGGILEVPQAGTALLGGAPDAYWCFQQMQYSQDLAIAQLQNQNLLSADYLSFAAGYYPVTKNDVQTPAANIRLVAGSKQCDGYILDFNIAFEVAYETPRYVGGIILIGSTNNKDTSLTLSTEGDSGGCVYHIATGKLIGILVGGNDKFSLVLPVEETLTSFNFKLI